MLGVSFRFRFQKGHGGLLGDLAAPLNGVPKSFQPFHFVCGPWKEIVTDEVMASGSWFTGYEIGFLHRFNSAAEVSFGSASDAGHQMGLEIGTRQKLDTLLMEHFEKPPAGLVGRCKRG